MVEFKMAEKADVLAIAALEKELFSDAWSEGMLNDCLSQSHYRVVACVNASGDVVGYLISAHIAGEAELLRIGVDPSMRRQGIGRLLMKVFTKLCEELLTTEAFLEVRASNLAAIALYDQFGFDIVGTRKNYYHYPQEDACLMAAIKCGPRI